MPIIEPTIPDRVTLKSLRTQIAAIITLAVDNKPTRIHSEWKLKAEIGKNVSLFHPEGETIVHCWMIGTESLLPLTDANGDYQFVGSTAVDREAKFSIWGFFDYAIKDAVENKSSQEIAEEEAELIADWIKANKNHLGIDTQPAEIRRVKPMMIENIDNHDFSDGFSCIVAQCSLVVGLRR